MGKSWINLSGQTILHCYDTFMSFRSLTSLQEKSPLPLSRAIMSITFSPPQKTKTVALGSHVLTLLGKQTPLRIFPSHRCGNWGWEWTRHMQRREAKKGKCYSLSIYPDPACALCSYMGHLIQSLHQLPKISKYFICILQIRAQQQGAELTSNPILPIPTSFTSCWFHHGSHWLPNPQYVSFR